MRSTQLIKTSRRSMVIDVGVCRQDAYAISACGVSLTIRRASRRPGRFSWERSVGRLFYDELQDLGAGRGDRRTVPG